jgi:hypothetical protein
VEDYYLLALAPAQLRMLVCMLKYWVKCIKAFGKSWHKLHIKSIIWCKLEISKKLVGNRVTFGFEQDYNWKSIEIAMMSYCHPVHMIGFVILS